MSWSFVSKTEHSAATTPWLVPYPAGIVAGDVLVLFLGVDNTARRPSFLPGWEFVVEPRIGTDVNTTMLFRMADGLETGTLSVAWDAISRGGGVIACYRNSDSAYRTRMGAAAIGGHASGSASRVLTPVTTPTNDSLIIAAMAIDANVAATIPQFTWSSGWVKRADFEADSNVVLTIADLPAPTAGTYGGTVTIVTTAETTGFSVMAAIENIAVPMSLEGTAIGVGTSALDALSGIVSLSEADVVDEDSNQVTVIAEGWETIIVSGELEATLVGESAAFGELFLHQLLNGEALGVGLAEGKLRLPGDTIVTMDLSGVALGASASDGNLLLHQRLFGIAVGRSQAVADLVSPLGLLLDSAFRFGSVPTSWRTTPRIWRSDMFQTKIEEVLPARAVSATVTYNEDFETKRKATIDVINPDALRDLVDFVVLELEIVDNFGNQRVLNLGHYVVMGRTVTMDNHGRRGTIELRDLTWLLQRATVDQQFRVLAGTDHGFAARQLLYQHGFPESIVDIPDSNTVLTSDFVSLEGDTWLGVLIEVLSGGSMYQPWMAASGKVTSRKGNDVRHVNADAVYRTADGAKIVPPISNTPDISRVNNRVTVRKLAQGEDPGFAETATITDPGNPLHPERLQQLMGSTQPVILGITYDEATIETPEQAQALATSRLSLAATFFDKVSITTYADHTLDGHQALELDIADGNDHYYTGLWLQQSWELTLSGPKALVTRSLTRTMNWS